MNSDQQRWNVALEGIAHLRVQARAVLNELWKVEDRQDPEWRVLWGHWQEELKELRACEADARAALRALETETRQAA